MGLILNKKTIAILLLLLLLVCPWLSGPYYMHLIIVCFIWAVVASAWNLIMGYAGIYSFAQLAFFTVGAYAAGMVEIWFKMSPWLGLPIGGFIAALAGLIIAFPCLKLKGLYICLVTIAFHQVIPIFIKLGATWTGGDVGLMGMPHYSLFGYNFGSSRIYYYYLAFFVFLLFQYVIYRIIQSNIGLAFVALRDSEGFAESLGVNRQKCNLIVFSVSAFITGLMGALYIHYLKVATPRTLEIEIFAAAIMMVVIGGLGNFSGSILGAFFVTFLDEFLRTAGLIRPIIFGAIIVVGIILFPSGLGGLADSLFQFIGGHVDSSTKRKMAGIDGNETR
jgi:branched-chain amino acid transport system permease protein